MWASVACAGVRSCRPRALSRVMPSTACWTWRRGLRAPPPATPMPLPPSAASSSGSRASPACCPASPRATSAAPSRRGPFWRSWSSTLASTRPWPRPFVRCATAPPPPLRSPCLTDSAPLRLQIPRQFLQRLLVLADCERRPYVLRILVLLLRQQRAEVEQRRVPELRLADHAKRRNSTASAAWL